MNAGRKLTVLRAKWNGSIAGKERGSSLFLNGQWLKRWGFHPGMSVAVAQTQAGVMEIRVQSPVQCRAADFTALIDNFSRIGV